jgi:hypothetical protein
LFQPSKFDQLLEEICSHGIQQVLAAAALICQHSEGGGSLISQAGLESILMRFCEFIFIIGL